MDLRCPNCRRMLAKVEIAQGLQIKCQRCGQLAKFNVQPQPKPLPRLTPAAAAR